MQCTRDTFVPGGDDGGPLSLVSGTALTTKWTAAMSALDYWAQDALAVSTGPMTSSWATGGYRPPSARPAGDVRAEARQARNLTTRVR